MTNPNSPSSNPQSADLSPEILAKVNAHADRSIDRLFSDLEELFQNDVEEETPIPSVDRSFTPPNSSHSSNPPNLDTPFTPPNLDTPFTPPNLDTPFTPPNYVPTSDSESNFQAPKLRVETLQPEELKTTPKKQGFPLWGKVFIGIGLISIASSSLLLWLIKENKITLPRNLTPSWLPVNSQPQVSAADAKFADYMRKSISTIESSNSRAAAKNITPTTTPVEPVNIIPVSTIPTPGITPSATPELNSLKTKISLVETLDSGERVGATFQIGNRSQTVNIGGKIGNSGWSLSTVTANSIIIIKPGSQNRSISIGQKF
jgi:hypothetical protein